MINKISKNSLILLRIMTIMRQEKA